MDVVESFTTKAGSTRIGRGVEFFNSLDSSPVIIIDFREFRCDLPAQLFYLGFKIYPLMLKVGDYVLSNGCLIERKAVETGDLIESIIGKRIED
jgi:ERCC4-type nuclease